VSGLCGLVVSLHQRLLHGTGFGLWGDSLEGLLGANSGGEASVIALMIVAGGIGYRCYQTTSWFERFKVKRIAASAATPAWGCLALVPGLVVFRALGLLFNRYSVTGSSGLDCLRFAWWQKKFQVVIFIGVPTRKSRLHTECRFLWRGDIGKQGIAVDDDPDVSIGGLARGYRRVAIKDPHLRRLWPAKRAPR